MERLRVDLRKFNPGSPLMPLLDEINIAAQNNLAFLALAMTVALPDICVSLSSPDGRSNGVRYKDWCRENITADFCSMTPDDLYSLRCGVLHNGRFGDLKHNYARVAFLPPGGNVLTMIDCRVEDTYCYSVVEFCANFTAAVSAWFEKHKTDANVRGNLPRLMQYRADALPLVMDGILVIG